MKKVKFRLAGGFGSAELVDDAAAASICALDDKRCYWGCARLDRQAFRPPAAVCSGSCLAVHLKEVLRCSWLVLDRVLYSVCSHYVYGNNKLSASAGVLFVCVESASIHVSRSRTGGCLAVCVAYVFASRQVVRVSNWGGGVAQTSGRYIHY